ncbi:MAG: nickel pincer cofactor biosynthesis protein LarC [Ktedonobacteraceae bacterium]
MLRIAYLDCRSGIDGETLLGALLDAGFSLDMLKRTLALFPLQEYDIVLEHTTNKGVRGTRVTVTLTSQEHKIYTWSEIEMLLSSTQIPLYIRNTTLSILQHWVDAAAIVHGEGYEQQAFEVSLQTLVIVIGVVTGLKELEVTQLYASVLPLTNGYIETANGHIPVPTPVTLEILRHVHASWKPIPAEGEVVTPLGAILLATLARFDTPTMTIERVGYGFGAQSLPFPGALRLYLGILQGTEQLANGDADTDWVTILSTNIDNMSGELLGGLMERLFAAGALDVSYTPLQMKKNRPATLLMIVCPLEKGNELAYILLRETTTLGVRMQQVQRLKAQRTPQHIATPLGPMLIKVKRLGAQIISASPEYEECQRIAHERNMPLADVYAVAQQWIANTLHKVANSEYTI